MIPQEANKILTENSKYHTGVGTVVKTTDATTAVNTAFKEGIDACILELENNGENETPIRILKKIKSQL